MLGHAEEWFYTGLAGIDFDLSRPLGQQIEIHPYIVGDIASAQASFDSVLGPIASQWNCKDGECTLDVTIPIGADAQVRIPSTRASSITESGNALVHAAGVRLIRTGKDAVICEIESGQYHFKWSD